LAREYWSAALQMVCTVAHEASDHEHQPPLIVGLRALGQMTLMGFGLWKILAWVHYNCPSSSGHPCIQEVERQIVTEDRHISLPYRNGA